MTRRKSKYASVRSGFTFQQLSLIVLAFAMGVACATVVDQMIQHKGFGPNVAIAAQDNQTP